MSLQANILASTRRRRGQNVHTLHHLYTQSFSRQQLNEVEYAPSRRNKGPPLLLFTELVPPLQIQVPATRQGYNRELEWVMTFCPVVLQCANPKTLPISIQMHHSVLALLQCCCVQHHRPKKVWHATAVATTKTILDRAKTVRLHLVCHGQ